MKDGATRGTRASPGLPDALLTGAVLTVAIALNPISNDTVIPGIPSIREEFGVTAATAQLALSLHILAFAVMQLVYGPLSDRFGRRPIMLASMALYAVACILCALAPTLELLLAGRALQGVGAAGGPVIARAIIRDVYGAERSGKAMGYVMSAFGVIAVAAPMIGGVLVATFGWRSSFYFGLCYACAFMSIFIVLMHETLAPQYRQPARPGRIVRNMVMIARQRAFVVNTASNCAAYSAMFAWLSGALYILIEAAHVPVATASFFFALSTSGFMIGSAAAGRLSSLLPTGTLVVSGTLLALASVVVLWLFADAGVITIPAIVIPGFVWMLGYGFHYPMTMAAAVAPFPTMAGAASSLIGFLQMVCGAVAIYVTGAVFDGTSVPFSLLMIGLTALSLAIYLAGRRFA